MFRFTFCIWHTHTPKTVFQKPTETVRISLNEWMSSNQFCLLILCWIKNKNLLTKHREKWRALQRKFSGAISVIKFSPKKEIWSVICEYTKRQWKMWFAIFVQNLSPIRPTWKYISKVYTLDNKCKLRDRHWYQIKVYIFWAIFVNHFFQSIEKQKYLNILKDLLQSNWLTKVHKHAPCHTRGKNSKQCWLAVIYKSDNRSVIDFPPFELLPSIILA